MTKGKTKNGFSYEINEKMLKDWEVVTLLDSLSKNKASMAEINDLFNLLLSKEGFENLKNFVRDHNDGVVDAMALMEELKDILSNDKLKN